MQEIVGEFVGRSSRQDYQIELQTGAEQVSLFFLQQWHGDERLTEAGDLKDEISHRIWLGVPSGFRTIFIVELRPIDP